MKHFITWAACAAMGFITSGSPAAAAEKTYQLTVDAGKFDRVGSIVEFDLPKETPAGVWHVTRADRQTIAVQVRAGGHAAFFLPDPMPQGTHQSFKLEPGPGDARGMLEAAHKGDNIDVSWDGHSILRYDGGVVKPPEKIGPEFARGGYIHPVMTPSGKVLTDDFPPDHKHHHGIWAPWTHTEFDGHLVDFWNMGLKLGRVEFVAMDEPSTGPVFASLHTKHRFVDLTPKDAPKTALNETWDVVVYRTVATKQPYYVFDLIIHQECATDSPVLLPKYYYGGLGVRGSRQWDVAGNCNFLTSEGKERGDGNETRGRWCRMSGKIDGQPSSISIFDHPSNFRFPEPMRLNPKEPFFCYAPSQMGEWKIEPGKPFDARYRFIAADGETDANELDRLWNDWGAPVGVKVE